MKEIHRLKSFHHSRIVPYYDCLEDIRSLHLVMEYVPGVTTSLNLLNYFIYEIIKGVLTKCLPLQEKVAKKFLFQVLEALHYLHSNKVVHMDIKCEI